MPNFLLRSIAPWMFSSVYSVSMTILCVQIKGNETAVRVKTEHVDENKENGELLAKDSHGHVIGKFKIGEIVGWWTEE